MATPLADPTPALLAAFAPELSGYTDDQLQMLINRAEFRVSASFFGDQYNEAWLLMAAHIGVLFAPSTSSIASGAVKRKKVDALEVEYDVSGSARIPGQYAGSRYGAELWYIIQRIGVTPFTI